MSSLSGFSSLLNKDKDSSDSGILSSLADKASNLVSHRLQREEQW